MAKKFHFVWELTCCWGFSQFLFFLHILFHLFAISTALIIWILKNYSKANIQQNNKSNTLNNIAVVQWQLTWDQKVSSPTPCHAYMSLSKTSNTQLLSRCVSCVMGEMQITNLILVQWHFSFWDDLSVDPLKQRIPNFGVALSGWSTEVLWGGVMAVNDIMNAWTLLA